LDQRKVGLVAYPTHQFSERCRKYTGLANGLLGNVRTAQPLLGNFNAFTYRAYTWGDNVVIVGRVIAPTIAEAFMQKLLVSILVAAFTITLARAQDNDQAHTRALLTLQAIGTLGAMVKGWCDERNPQGQTSHAAALSAWRKSVALDEIDARLALRTRSSAGDMQDQRARLQSQRRHSDRAATRVGR
jgi:hypothetical protein